MEHTGIPASLYSSCRTTCMSPWDLGPCGVLWTLQVDQSGSEPTFNLQKPLSSSWTPVPISCRDRGDSCWALEVRAVMWHRDWDVSRWEKSWQWLTDWGGKWRSGMRKERYLTLLASIATERRKLSSSFRRLHYVWRWGFYFLLQQKGFLLETDVKRFLLFVEKTCLSLFM